MQFSSKDDISQIIIKLGSLSPERKPNHGMMSAQHMVEHLAITFQICNGERPLEQVTEDRVASIGKRRLIGSDAVFPKGFKAPVLPEDDVLPLQYGSISEAIEALETEMRRFFDYFGEDETQKPVHPVLGPLSMQEWLVFHQKHLVHHLDQFGLV